MMPALINGSPTHVLVVHAVVVLLPLSVVASLLLVFVKATRHAFGLLTVAVAFVGCLSVPLAFLSGSALRRRLPPSPLIDRHVALAHQLLPVAAVFGLSLAAFVGVDLMRRARSGQLNAVESAALKRRSALARHGSSSRLSAAHLATAILLVVTSLLTAFAVVRVGDSGAKAAWAHRLSSHRAFLKGS